MTKTPTASKALNLALWLIQGLLALTFIGTGAMKLFQPEALPFPWIEENTGLVFITGVVDLLGGIGILLPALLRIQPWLSVLAAYGIAALMLAASIFHVSRGEAKDIGFNVLVFLLAVFVAWGRQKKVPVHHR